jgi:hypothetical protein
MNLRCPIPFLPALDVHSETLWYCSNKIHPANLCKALAFANEVRNARIQEALQRNGVLLQSLSRYSRDINEAHQCDTVACMSGFVLRVMWIEFEYRVERLSWVLSD